MQRRPSLREVFSVTLIAMNHHLITDKDRQAIEKSELDEFERRKLRGTGYDMMTHRDRGWGRLHDERTAGKEVEVFWSVEDGREIPMQVTETDEEKRVEVYPPKIPQDKFLIRIGNEEALIDKEAFQKLFRWV